MSTVSPASLVQSRFDESATAAEVLEGIDLRGRQAIVTGASSGVGAATAQALAAAGATVTLAVRDVAAGKRVAQEIAREVSRPQLAVESLDLASLHSVRKFAERWGQRPLALLINNAGVMATPFARTGDGFELQLAVNHFGHFLLTRLLAPCLRAAAPARVIVLSSAAHHMSDVQLDDLHYANRPYERFMAYAQSKTANNLFAVGVTRHWGRGGIVANAVSPGAVHTNLGRHVDRQAAIDLGWLRADGSVPDMLFKTPAQGAATTVWAATAPALETQGGLYLEDCQQSLPWTAAQPLKGVKGYSLNPARADALWELSARLTG